MNVCTKCNLLMQMCRSGVAMLEVFDDGRPYRLWMADLWHCRQCGMEFLHVGVGQKPVAEHYQDDFAAKLATYKPEYRAGERAA